jgi:SagB-type dehydrogenase family enzyme
MHPVRPALLLCACLCLASQEALPPPASGGMPLTEALAARKTVRSLGGPGLTLAEAGQLLWAAQGENRPERRTVPSAHAKYPLELYLITQGSPTLPAGEYHYQPGGHKLLRLAEAGPEDLFGRLRGMQPWISAAPAVFVVAGVPTRLDPSGRPQALNLTYYEGGAAAQDLLLQAAALGLGAGTASGLDMEALGQALKLPRGTVIMSVLPVGREKN